MEDCSESFVWKATAQDIVKISLIIAENVWLDNCKLLLHWPQTALLYSGKEISVKNIFFSAGIKHFACYGTHFPFPRPARPSFSRTLVVPCSSGQPILNHSIYVFLPLDLKLLYLFLDVRDVQLCSYISVSYFVKPFTLLL